MKQANVVRTAKIVVARTIIAATVTFLAGGFLYGLVISAELRETMLKFAGLGVLWFVLAWAANNWSPDV